jgi:hypothetical protein
VAWGGAAGPGTTARQLGEGSTAAALAGTGARARGAPRARSDAAGPGTTASRE